LRYLFENYALDTDRRELCRGNELLPVEPKVFDLLVYLIANRERVVSKDDLISAIWDGRIVSESALTTCLNAARSAIGDNGNAQRLIKTLPRKGFRFVGTARDPQQDAEMPPEQKPVLSLPDQPSIAVLPFINISGNSEQEYFADGMVDDIITELSRFSELFVIARNSSFTYKGKAVDVRRVGRELGVRYVLEGSIRRASGRVRMSAQLIDAISGSHRWAERYDREMKDIFATQDEVVRTIVAVLAAQVNKAEAERILLKPPASWQAYDYYMRAADTFNSFWSSLQVRDLRNMRTLLEHALQRDPNYGRAYALLSGIHMTAWTNPLDDDYLKPLALDRAYELARKAVQLDPNLPQGRAQLGSVLVQKREHAASIAEFERATALNPNFTDWYAAAALVYAGEPSRAIEVGKTHMRLDPFCPALAPGFLGLAYYMLKEYSEALALLRECVSRAPNFRAGHVWLAATYARLAQVESAQKEAAEVLRIHPGYTIDKSQRPVAAFKSAQDAEHLFDGLRMAGLPEE
jgi:adenylate cyclase